MQALLALVPVGLPRMQEIGLDGRVLGFTLGIALMTGIAFGTLSAWHVFRSDLSGALRDGARQTSDRGRLRVRSVFAGAEAVLAVVLLTGAGLLLSSFYRLSTVEPGFDPDGVFLAQFKRTPADYSSADRVWSFEREVLERIRQIPGVVSAAATSTPPLQGQYNFPMTVVGRSDATQGAVQWRAVTPSYFETLRTPLLRGRTFSEHDDARAAPVVIINETFARKFFGDEDPIGHRIDIGTFQGEEVIPDFDDPERVIVGVVADTRDLGLGVPTAETMFIPRLQAPEGVGVTGLGGIIIRAGRADGIREAVLAAIREGDPRMPVSKFVAMRDAIGASVAEERFHAVLLGTFAGLALLLTVIGIYGVVAYTVGQRTGEIGIRMALGAHPDGVLRLIVRQGMTPVAIGLGIGIALALALTRLISGLLYGVSATEPAVFAAVPIVLAAVALVATYLPARRAAQVDPVIALRSE